MEGKSIRKEERTDLSNGDGILGISIEDGQTAGYLAEDVLLGGRGARGAAQGQEGVDGVVGAGRVVLVLRLHLRLHPVQKCLYLKNTVLYSLPHVIPLSGAKDVCFSLSSPKPPPPAPHDHQKTPLWARS